MCEAFKVGLTSSKNILDCALRFLEGLVVCGAPLGARGLPEEPIERKWLYVEL